MYVKLAAANAERGQYNFTLEELAKLGRNLRSSLERYNNNLKAVNSQPGGADQLARIQQGYMDASAKWSAAQAQSQAQAQALYLNNNQNSNGGNAESQGSAEAMFTKVLPKGLKVEDLKPPPAKRPRLSASKTGVPSPLSMAESPRTPLPPSPLTNMVGTPGSQKKGQASTPGKRGIKRKASSSSVIIPPPPPNNRTQSNKEILAQAFGIDPEEAKRQQAALEAAAPVIQTFDNTQSNALGIDLAQSANMEWFAARRRLLQATDGTDPFQALVQALEDKDGASQNQGSLSDSTAPLLAQPAANVSGDETDDLFDIYLDTSSYDDDSGENLDPSLGQTPELLLPYSMSAGLASGPSGTFADEDTPESAGAISPTSTRIGTIGLSQGNGINGEKGDVKVETDGGPADLEESRREAEGITGENEPRNGMKVLDIASPYSTYYNGRILVPWNEEELDVGKTAVSTSA